MSRTRQSVILDTNVLLAGTLGRVGPSAFLPRLKDHFQFFVPEGVIAEALDFTETHGPMGEHKIFQTLLYTFRNGVNAQELRHFAFLTNFDPPANMGIVLELIHWVLDQLQSMKFTQ